MTALLVQLNDASREAVTSDIRRNYPHGALHLNEVQTTLEAIKCTVALVIALSDCTRWTTAVAQCTTCPAVALP